MRKVIYVLSLGLVLQVGLYGYLHLRTSAQVPSRRTEVPAHDLSLDLKGNLKNPVPAQPQDAGRSESGGRASNRAVNLLATRLDWDASQPMFELLSTYLTLIEADKLPPETLAKLRRLLLERETAAKDAREVARDNKLSRRDIQMAVKDSVGAVDKEIQDVLPPEYYSRFKKAVSRSLEIGTVEATYAPAIYYEAGNHLSGHGDTGPGDSGMAGGDSGIDQGGSGDTGGSGGSGSGGSGTGGGGGWC